MYGIEDEVVIGAPPATVWQWTVEDVERERSWRNLEGKGAQSLERVDDGPLAVGSRFRGTVKVGPGAPQAYTNVVTELDDRRLISWETTDADGPLFGFGSYVLAPTDGGARFQIKLAYPAQSLMGRMQRPVVRFLGARLFIPRMLAKLKTLIEQEQRSDTAG